MIQRYLLLATVLYVTFAAYPTTDSLKDLLRCHRVDICDESLCEYGTGTDVRGCPSCDCRPSPCLNHVCERSGYCYVSLCGGNCIEAKCQDKPNEDNCEMGGAYCAEACPLGFVDDKNGCNTCECKKFACQNHLCEGGFVCESRNIDHSLPQPFCVEKEQTKLVEVTTSPYECPPCSRDFGYKTVNGRSTCECKMNICDGYECEKGMACETHYPCRDCSPEPICKVISLCENHAFRDSSVMCSNSGQFEPRRCDSRSCWCINEAGEEVIGSRSIGNHTRCDYMRSTIVNVEFKLVHQITNIKIHLKGIKQVLHEHISQWMSIERTLINFTIVEDHHEKHMQILVVKVRVLSDEHSIDLPSAVFNLRYMMQNNKCHLRFHTKEHPTEHNLHVDNGDSSLQVRHHFKHYDTERVVRRFYRYHLSTDRSRLIMMVMMLGACILMISSFLVLCMLCNKRKSLRNALPQWRKNMINDLSRNPYAKFDDDDVIVEPGNGKEKLPLQGPIIQVAPPMADELIVA